MTNPIDTIFNPTSIAMFGLGGILVETIKACITAGVYPGGQSSGNQRTGYQSADCLSPWQGRRGGRLPGHAAFHGGLSWIRAPDREVMPWQEEPGMRLWLCGFR